MILGVTLDEIKKSWELQRTYLFELVLPDMNGIPGTEVSKYCQAIEFGGYNIAEASKMKLGAYRGKYAGILDIDDITATFLQPIPDIVSSYFYSWRDVIVSPEGYYFPKNYYAKTLRIYQLDNRDNITNVYKATGVFPLTVPRQVMDFNSEDIPRLEITFSVDKLFLE